MFKSRELTMCLARKECLLRLSEINRCLLMLDAVRVQPLCNRIDTVVTIGRHAARLWPVITPLLVKHGPDADRAPGILSKAKRGLALTRFLLGLFDKS
jgi:hypothetical protein